MNILMVIAHPEKASFNHAVAAAAAKTLRDNGHEIVFHDLYEERFDPVLPYDEIPGGADIGRDIETHCRQLGNADGIIIVHPNWWGQPPAILKGWIDRVIRCGVAYKFQEGDCGEGVPVGLLKARTALVFNTSNTPEARELETFGDPLERIWRDCIFSLCGVKIFYRKMFRVVVTSTAEERECWLRETGEIVGRHFPSEID